jgi:hypothetical protein
VRFTEEIFHLLEWTRNKLAEKVEILVGNPTLIKVENQTPVKENFKLKKTTKRYKKGKMGTLKRALLILNLYMKMECS